MTKKEVLREESRGRSSVYDIRDARGCEKGGDTGLGDGCYSCVDWGSRRTRSHWFSFLPTHGGGAMGKSRRCRRNSTRMTGRSLQKVWRRPRPS